MNKQLSISINKMHFANCVAVAAVLFTTLIENLRLCSSAYGIVLEQK